MPIQIQWLGHASVLVEDRARILTDPVLTGSLMHLRRRAGPVPLSLTSQVDAVVISHLHVDHLHYPSLALIDPEQIEDQIRAGEAQLAANQAQVNQAQATVAEAQAQLGDAICAAARASAGLGQVLAEGHPVRGIALAELGKLLSVDEPDPAHARGPAGPPTGAMGVAPGYPPSGPTRVKLAYETLLRARAELLVGFGSGANEGGVVGRGVREMAAELEKEMQVWKAGVKNVLDDQRQAGRR